MLDLRFVAKYVGDKLGIQVFAHFRDFVVPHRNHVAINIIVCPAADYFRFASSFDDNFVSLCDDGIDN
jgi:hypothetical protein